MHNLVEEKEENKKTSADISSFMTRYQLLPDPTSLLALSSNFLFILLKKKKAAVLDTDKCYTYLLIASNAYLCKRTIQIVPQTIKLDPQ